MHTKILNVQLAMYKKYLLTLLLLALFSLPAQSLAQTPAINSGQLTLPSPIYYKSTESMPTYQSPNSATMAMYNFGHGLMCILTGSSPINPCLEYSFTKNLQGAVSSTPYLSSANTSGGLLGLGTSMITLMYEEKPLDQMSLWTYMGKNIGLIDVANAQVPGSGNTVLSPIFALWTVSRNISYLVMILIFVGVGLMVMFRQKLNPQTVVTAQMALPGLVIGLVLITFSYFLASLLTDVAYVATDMVGYYFDEAIKVNGGTPATGPLTQRLASENPLTIGGGSTTILDQESIKYFIDQGLRNLPWTQGSATQTLITNPTSIVKWFAASMTYLIYNSFLSPVGDVVGGTFSTAAGLIRWNAGRGGATVPNAVGAGTSIAGAIIGGTPTAIAAGAGAAAFADPSTWLAFWATVLSVLILLYTIVKLALRLINSYLMIIFLTIISPFVFLASSIPGRQGSVTDWIKNMLCNVLAFPAVIGVFYFAAFLIGRNSGTFLNYPIPAFGVTDPLSITNATGNLPFLGGLQLEYLRKILAFVAILATPSIPDVICKAVGKPGQAGGVLAGAIGGAISSGRSYEGQMTGQVTKAGSDVSSWRNSLLGTKHVQAGRFGDVQLGLVRRAGKDPLSDGKEVGVDHKQTGFWGTLERGTDKLRSSMASKVPLSGSKASAQKGGDAPFGT